MTITQKQVLEWDKTLPTFKKGCGAGLIVRKYPSVKSGGIYFKGVYQKQECHIGKFGKSAGELSLADARRKWDELKRWAIENQCHLADYTKQKEQEISDTKTFGDAVDWFMQLKMKKIKETTIREYRLKLDNQVMPLIPADTPLTQLEWKNGGRETVMNAVEKIADGGKWDLAHRCQGLMRQVFNSAISRGWMSEGRNPADKLKGDESPEPAQHHHCHIGWDDVPELLSAVNLNRCNTHIQSVLATKLLLMTFLRAGALSRLEWSWFGSEFDDVITIPGDTPGLKRNRGKNDGVPHHVPITPEMEAVFSTLRELNGDTRYVFQPLRQSRFPHIDPSAPNNYLKNLGYEGVLRAHGWRSTANTAGTDILGIEYDVIKRQMGHLPEGKVRQAYDNSIRLKERTEYMRKWTKLLVDTGLKV